MEGIVQIPIDPEIGNTFAHCLRSILRQDPDKILVGEIRDLETAEIAVQASLTGPHRLQHAAHQRRPQHDHASERHGRADVSDYGHAWKPFWPSDWCAASAPNAAKRPRPPRK